VTRLAVLVGAWLVFMVVPFLLGRVQAPPKWTARLGFIALLGLVASTTVLLAAVLMPEVLVLSSLRQVWEMCSAAFHAIGGNPLARAPSIIAGIALGIVLGRFWWTLVQGVRAMRRARIRQLEPTWRLERGQSVYVLPLDQPEAYSLGSARGQVVISQGLLDVLDEEERRAVLLHEEGHLRAGHQLMLLVARAAATALQPLAPARATMSEVEQAVEEAADAYAAMRLGRPGVVARSLTKAALAGLRDPAGAVALGAGPDVPARVRRLLDPPEVPRWIPAACGVMAVGLLGLIAVTQMVAGVAVVAAAHHFIGLGTATFCPAMRPRATGRFG